MYEVKVEFRTLDRKTQYLLLTNPDKFTIVTTEGADIEVARIEEGQEPLVVWVGKSSDFGTYHKLRELSRQA